MQNILIVHAYSFGSYLTVQGKHMLTCSINVVTNSNHKHYDGMLILNDYYGKYRCPLLIHSVLSLPLSWHLVQSISRVLPWRCNWSSVFDSTDVIFWGSMCSHELELSLSQSRRWQSFESRNWDSEFPYVWHTGTLSASSNSMMIIALNREVDPCLTTLHPKVITW